MLIACQPDITCLSNSLKQLDFLVRFRVKEGLELLYEYSVNTVVCAQLEQGTELVEYNHLKKMS